MVKEIIQEDAMYEDKFQVKQLHHIWCRPLEASKETYHMSVERFISWRQRTHQTSSTVFWTCGHGWTGWIDWQCLGRLGQLHCLSSACLWEWTRCAGSSGFLGPSRAFQRWQRWELQAPSCHRNQAWPNFDACNHGIHHPRTYWEIPWLLVSICRLEVCRCSQWTCSNLQSASSRLGSDRGIHGLLRSFPRPVPWNRSLCWRLWMEAHHIGWPRGEENQA